MVALGFINNRIQFHRNRKYIGEMDYKDFVRLNSNIQDSVHGIIDNGLDTLSSPVQLFMGQSIENFSFINGLSKKQRGKTVIRVKDFEMAMRFVNVMNIFNCINGKSIPYNPVIENAIWNRLVDEGSIQNLAKCTSLTAFQFRAITEHYASLCKEIATLLSQYNHFLIRATESEEKISFLYYREDLLFLDFKKLDRVKINIQFDNIQSYLLDLDFANSEKSLSAINQLIPQYEDSIRKKEAIQQKFKAVSLEYQKLFDKYSDQLMTLMAFTINRFKPPQPPGLKELFPYTPNAIPKRIDTIKILEGANQSNHQIVSQFESSLKEARDRITLYMSFVSRLDHLIEDINKNNAQYPEIPYKSNTDDLKGIAIGWNLSTPLTDIQRIIGSLTQLEDNYQRYSVIRLDAITILDVLSKLNQEQKALSDRFPFPIEISPKLVYGTYLNSLCINLTGYDDNEKHRILDLVKEYKALLTELSNFDKERTCDIKICQRIITEYPELTKSRDLLSSLSSLDKIKNIIEFKENSARIADCKKDIICLTDVAVEYIDLKGQLDDFSRFFEDESYQREINTLQEQFKKVFVEEKVGSVIEVRDAAARKLDDMISREWSRLPHHIVKSKELLGKAEMAIREIKGCDDLEADVYELCTILKRVEEEKDRGFTNGVQLKELIELNLAIMNELTDVTQTIRSDIKSLMAKISFVTHDSRSVMSQFDLINEECQSYLDCHDMKGALEMRGQLLSASTLIFFPYEIPKDLLYSLSDDVRRDLYDV